MKFDYIDGTNVRRNVLKYAKEHGIALDYFEVKTVKCRGITCRRCLKEVTTICPECGSDRKGKLGTAYGEAVICECGAILTVCTMSLSNVFKTKPEDLVITGYVSSMYTKMAAKEDLI